MNKYKKYLKYVLKHKYYVLIECYKHGILWQGIIHDLSKFRISEFFAYSNYFDKYKPRDKSGYYKPTDTGDVNFDIAWLKHTRRNPHHWQYWVLLDDDGTYKVFEMPLNIRKEMICDWIGAGKAQNKPDTKEWYLQNRHRMVLGKETREWVNNYFAIIDLDEI